jgi:hypothetical protein
MDPAISSHTRRHLEEASKLSNISLYNFLATWHANLLVTTSIGPFFTQRDTLEVEAAESDSEDGMDSQNEQEIAKADPGSFPAGGTYPIFV